MSKISEVTNHQRSSLKLTVVTVNSCSAVNPFPPRVAEPAKWQLQKVLLWLAKHTQDTNIPTMMGVVYSSSDIVLMAEHTPPLGSSAEGFG